MSGTLYLKGKKYISARQAADVTGYDSDYVGQLCRAKKITANLIGRSWYVLESEILDHKDKNSLTHKKTLKTRELKKNGLLIKSGYKNKNLKEKEDRTEKISTPESRISNTRDVREIKPLYQKDKKESKLYTQNTRDVREIKPSLYFTLYLCLYYIKYMSFVNGT